MAKKKLPAQVIKQVRAYLETLRADNLPISQAIVFGSFATGTSHRYSDIDLCIISPRFRDSWKAMQYLWARRPGDSGLTIEPLGLRAQDLRHDSELTREIKKHGIVVE